jgi:hypothetical protein
MAAVRQTAPEQEAPEPSRAQPGGAPQQATSLEQLLALQSSVGNAAVARMLQRQPAATAEARPASAVNPENLEQMRLDVAFITAKLKQQVLDSGEEQELLDRVKAWAGWDESWAATGGAGTPFLDKFLVLLKTRTFPRATARMLFGLAGDEWINAYDGLFYELEGPRKDALQAIVSKSQKQGTAGPETQQMESVYGFVGKRVGLGSWGILKQMGLAVMSIADALIWLEWRREGRPGDPPQLSPSVAKSFDESAAILADIAKEGATPEQMERDKQAMMEQFGFGDRWGKIVGILMSAGMGSAGQTVKAISSAAQIAQGAQGVEAAAKKIQLRIAAMRKANPKATWEDFIADDEVRLEIGNGLAALIGLIGSLAGDEGVVAEFLKRNHLLVSATVLTPMLKKAWMDYNDPDLAADPKRRQHMLEEDVATIVGTVASMIGSRYDAKRAQEKAAADAKAKAEAQAAEPVVAEDVLEVAASPTEDEPAGAGGAQPEEEGPATMTTPPGMENVLLIDVTPAQLEAVLVELEGSTATGREIARRVRAGELQLTMDTGQISERAVGLANTKEVHVTWEGSVQDVAGTLIHEAVHQGDPMLAAGGPRTQVEATARVAEFEYRAEAGLPPRDSVENIYRAVLEQGAQQNLPPAEAQARARQAMIDMMQADPSLYRVEPAGGGEGGEGGPAASSRIDPEARVAALETRLEALESHPDSGALADALERAQSLRDAGRTAEADAMLAQLEREVDLIESGSETHERPFAEEEERPDVKGEVEYTPGESVPVQLDATAPPGNDPIGQVLLEHVEQAVARYESEGLTDRQAEALRTIEAQGGDAEALQRAFRGARIDEFAKQSVQRDPRLESVLVTGLMERGADFYDVESGRWYDITTTAAWQDHLDRYGLDPSGAGARLPTETQ